MEKLIKTQGDMKHLETVAHPTLVELTMKHSGKGRMRCEIAVQMTEKLSEAIEYAKAGEYNFINQYR